MIRHHHFTWQDGPCMEFRRPEEPDGDDPRDLLALAIERGDLEPVPLHHGSHEAEVFVEVWWDNLVSAGLGAEAGRVLAAGRYFQRFEDGRPAGARVLSRLQELAANAWGDILDIFELDGRCLRCIGDTLYWADRGANIPGCVLDM